MYPFIIFFIKVTTNFRWLVFLPLGTVPAFPLLYIVHCTWHFGALLLCMRDAIQLGFPNHFTYTQLAYILILSGACPST